MSNITNTLSRIRYTEDINKLRYSIPLLQRFSDKEIELLYDAFSDSYAAGWLILTEETITEFAASLER